MMSKEQYEALVGLGFEFDVASTHRRGSVFVRKIDIPVVANDQLTAEDIKSFLFKGRAGDESAVAGNVYPVSYYKSTDGKTEFAVYHYSYKRGLGFHREPGGLLDDYLIEVTSTDDNEDGYEITDWEMLQADYGKFFAQDKKRKAKLGDRSGLTNI